ncbi:HK97 gp10 family phage protein [Leucobacter iarius]|uniref:HK97 gp10 family phage protein n=1 Tax=Leucobacter iarius TaxID=333963 RepID=A0ABN2LJX6_9MICO
MGSTVSSGSEYLRIEQRGAAKFRKTLRAAGDDLEDMKEAHAKAAGIVEGETRRRVPRGATGRLAGSIRSSGTKTAGVIRAGRKSIPYAGVIHWGWPARHITPRPFAADAAKATESQWGRIYDDLVAKAISRIQGA